MSGHLCASGQWCRGRTVTNGERQPATITTPVGLCQPCQHWANAAIRDLPQTWRKLKLTLGDTPQHLNDGVRKPKPGARIPINTDADELMRAITETLNTAATIVAATLHARWAWDCHHRTTRHDHKLINAATTLITHHIATLAEHAPHTAIAIANLHHQARKHLGETRWREHQPLPCPHCNAPTLVKEIEDRRHTTTTGAGVTTPEVIHCLTCHGKWSETEYHWLQTIIVADLNAKDTHMLEWLLAERDWVLDTLATDLGLTDHNELITAVRNSAHASPESLA